MNGTDSNTGGCRRFTSRSLFPVLFRFLIITGVLTLGFGQGTPVQAAVGDTCGTPVLNICLMLDRTGSVSEQNLEDERDAAKALVDKIAGLGNGSGNGTRVAVGRFGDTNNGGLEAEIVHPLDTDYNDAKADIDTFLANNSSVGTNVADAVNVCQTHLANNPNGNQNVIILLSDFDPSEPTNPDTAAATAATNAKNAGTRIFTIGFDVSGESSADETSRALGASMASGNAFDNHCTATNCDHNGTDEIANENADGDDWFLAPLGAEIDTIFDIIFNVLGCADDGNACTQDICNNDTKKCESNPIPNCCLTNEECSDGNVCTNDICNAQTHVCSHTNNSNPCTDNSACTQTDVCQGGSCVGSNPVVCTALDECHIPGTCNPADGQCSNPEKPDETPCSDNDACTSTDQCIGGVCVPGTPENCDDGEECTSDSCDINGDCQHDPVEEETECEDNNICTLNDQCNAEGECTGTANPCDDGNPCTDDTCDAVLNPNNPYQNQETGCVNTPDTNNECSDGDACTQMDICDANGECVGSNPVVCEASDDCHDAGICQPQTGLCTDPAKQDGVSCTADSNECTDDVCQAGVCSHTNDDTNSCNDGDACTQTDACVAGACTGSNPIVCTALDECHVAGVCNPETGQCSDPNQPDGNSCTADSNECTDDVCQAGVCSHTNDDTNSCNDGDACTQTDSCVVGVCTGANPIVCTAVDECHEVGECVGGTCTNPEKEDGTLCTDTDGNSCSTAICEGGECDQSESAEGAACFEDSQCNGVDEIAIVNGLNGGSGSICNLETCGCCPDVNHDNVCDECSDNNPCPLSENECQENVCQAGTCATQNIEGSCNDGDSCTTDDTCSAGQCAPGPIDPACVPPSCGDGTCDEGETCGTCPNDCGQCPSSCGNGVCDADEDCDCPDCAETETCLIQAQRLKCAQNLTAESNGKISAQDAEDLAAELLANGDDCTLVLEGQSTIGGCSFQPGSANAQVPWVGLAALLIGWTPLVVLRRARARK